MLPTSPMLLVSDGEPNIELLRRLGWSVASAYGRYCVAWRGSDDAVFEWRSGNWHGVEGRSDTGE